MTTERSDVYITKEDIEADRDPRVDWPDLILEDRQAFKEINTKKLENHLIEYCAHGARMEPLPGLPHAVAVRFDPGEETPKDLYVCIVHVWHDHQIVQRRPWRKQSSLEVGLPGSFWE